MIFRCNVIRYCLISFINVIMIIMHQITFFLFFFSPAFIEILTSNLLSCIFQWIFSLTFQVILLISNWIQVGALTQPFQNTTLFFSFPKPFLSSFCPVIWLIVLLEHAVYFCPKCRCLSDLSSFFFHRSFLIFSSFYVAFDSNSLFSSSSRKITL